MSETRSLADLLGDTRARIVTEMQRRPMTAAGIAELLSISAAAARRHLSVLTRDGLIQSETVHDGSMGRPHDQWTLSARGRRLFPDRSAEFADELLDHLQGTYGRSALNDFLRGRAEQHADRYADRLDDAEDTADRAERLAQALSEDGFAARVVEGDDGGRTLTLLQSHCAIEGIAKKHPQVCAHEAALFKRLLGTKVSRRETIASGSQACVCHIDIPDNSSQAAISDRSA